MHILHVVGARPNFVKLAPVHAALSRRSGTRQTIIHTGQHYDACMSDLFFDQFSLPSPDHNLAVGSDSHARQTAEIMARFEPVLEASAPDMVLVYGDVNSTLAAALVCAKQRVSFGHVEAGLRAFDRSMPEEINRVVVDQLADLYFTPSPDGNDNLLREGIPSDRIHFVGNVMIDALVQLLPRAKKAVVPITRPYGLLTLHRPSNVDEIQTLKMIINVLQSCRVPIVFPVHPRTRIRLQQIGCPIDSSLRLLDPLPYIEFLALQSHASFVVTDSGGIQEETTFLGIPCITVRENTERPVTVTLGTNTLVGRDMAKLQLEISRVLAGQGKTGTVPELWDGKAADRIAECLVQQSRDTLAETA